MSMPELLAILEAARKDKNKEREFLAALQGIKLNEGDKDIPSFDDVKKRVLGQTQEQEFGIGKGIGYREE